MYCNFMSECGLNNMKENICCFYCKHRNNCNGICSEFSGSYFVEEVAKNCEDFMEVHMKAMINYWDDLQEENIFVGKGDYVVANETDYNITKGRKYRVEEVNRIDMITIRNDLGELDMFSVEWFDEYR